MIMPIHFDFPFYLTLSVIVTGFIVLLNKLFLAKKRSVDAKQPMLIEYARSFFPVLLIVLLIRSFLFQPYRVPTGSLEPTIMPGDFMIVSQYSYGLRLPVFRNKILDLGKPKVGDLALFHWPVDTSILFVKRIVGTPGDHVVYKNKELYVNGIKMEQSYIKKTLNILDGMDKIVDEFSESIPGKTHHILVDPRGGDWKSYDFIVPEHMYFAMGDNRDHSLDSRAWGFVPDSYLVGKPVAILFGWDSKNNKFRPNRFSLNLQ